MREIQKLQTEKMSLENELLEAREKAEMTSKGMKGMKEEKQEAEWKIDELIKDNDLLKS